MKKILSINTVLLFGILLGGCKKNEINYGETEAVNDKALLKFNYVSGYARNPSVQLSINGKRVSNLITARTPFPGGGYNTGGGSQPDYLSVTPGNIEIGVSIPKAGTDIDSVVLYKSNLTLEAGKNYIAHITDTAANTKTFLTQDKFEMAPEGKARYTFVNLMPNVPSVDLYFGSTKVASDIRYLASSPEFEVSVPASSTAWAIREAGAAATSTALATYTSASTYTNKRVYTAFALGYKGATDAVRKPYVSFLLVR